MRKGFALIGVLIATLTLCESLRRTWNACATADRSCFEYTALINTRSLAAEYLMEYSRAIIDQNGVGAGVLKRKHGYSCVVDIPKTRLTQPACAAWEIVKKGGCYVVSNVRITVKKPPFPNTNDDR